MAVIPATAHSRAFESPEAKARWFSSLPLGERMALLCEFTDLILTANPRIVDVKNAQPTQGRVQVIRRP